jgi:hypothetical protein
VITRTERFVIEISIDESSDGAAATPTERADALLYALTALYDEDLPPWVVSIDAVDPA